MLLSNLFHISTILGQLGPLRSPEDFNNFVLTTERGPTCAICHNFSHHSKTNVKRHIESKHFPNSFLYSCPNCGTNKKTKTALDLHLSKCNK